MELTDKQKNVLYRLHKGIQDGKLQQTLGGYAGTGKTTLVKWLVKLYPNFGVCAYTGKAANVLRKKGISARTIHSMIYRPYYEFNVLVGFELVPKIELGFDGFFVDESSMVSEEIYNDLKSYKLPIVFIGDHGQLEPVGSDFNLMKKPDYTLEEIHRNAGDIALFAERLRRGYKAGPVYGSEKVVMKKFSSITTEDLLEVDQVICAFNKTRVALNKQMRQGLGFEGLLNVGERVMCLKNNKNMGLFNGMQGIIKNLYECPHTNRKLMDFEFDNILYSGIWYDTKQFGQEKPEQESYQGKDYPNPFDYAYCITCHKSQGDEFDKVMVVEQKCSKWDHVRWAYTAASRAKEKLVWAF